MHAAAGDRIDPGFFGADPTRASAIDRRMRESLAASVSHVVERGAQHLRVSQTALHDALARIRSAPVPALVFGAYCDLVLAIGSDDLGTAQACLDELVAVANHGGALRILDLPDPRLDPAADRYRRLVDTDPETPLALAPPSPAAAGKCRERIHAAFELLERGSPNLAAEIRALLREIVLASPPAAPAAFEFDGASSFMLWGAIVLNAEADGNELDMAQALAHESGHNLLFGLCAAGPLLNNDGSERFSSPLRADPRPMDGIFHATYVLARMHFALKSLLDAGTLSGSQSAQAAHELAEHERRYAHGVATIERYGRLTALGCSVLEGTRRYMAGAKGAVRT